MNNCSELDCNCFPIKIIWKNGTGYVTLEIVDSFTEYVPPESVLKKQEEILSTYNDSVIFNNVCIRLKRIETIDNRLILFTERTTYYHTLITNRRMDFILDNHQSIRDIFEPGNAMSSLADSKMSNHIGFSVLIETADNCLAFSNRNKNVSTKKNTFDCAVSGSLKAKYALSSTGVLTVDGFLNAVSREVVDELSLPNSSEVRITENHLVALYRDYLEGGKPNFMFFYKIGYTSEQLRSFVFKSDDNQDGNKMNVDLDAMITIERLSFEKAFVDQERILFRRNNAFCEMPISPNTGGVLSFFRDYLTQ